jgi:transposase
LKREAAQHSDWLLVDEDESWFSRFEQPSVRAWSATQALQRVEREAPEHEPDKALACYGALRYDTQHVYFAFSDTRPVSEETWKFVQGLLEVAQQEGKRVLVIIWDNAGWHLSKRLRQWIRQHNRVAKATGTVRLLTHLLPLKSPWLNPIEPRWVHAKRAIWEPNGALSVDETKRRLCAHFGTQSL